MILFSKTNKFIILITPNILLDTKLKTTRSKNILSIFKYSLVFSTILILFYCLITNLVITVILLCTLLCVLNKNSKLKNKMRILSFFYITIIRSIFEKIKLYQENLDQSLRQQK